MKVRASKNIHNTEKTLEEFKLTEFSKDLDQFVPDLSLSCNECKEQEDENAHQDSIVSFLIKFKADKLSDPKKVHGGVEGMLLPEEEGYSYEKELGEAGFFHSVTVNHYNRTLTSEQLDALALELYSVAERRRSYTTNEVESYLAENYGNPEWANLLGAGKKTKWKRYIKEILKRAFTGNYCDLERGQLEQMLRTDPEGLKQAIRDLNAFDCFNGPEKDQIRQALGMDFI